MLTLEYGNLKIVADTPEEVAEVVGLLARPLQNGEIAHTLGVSERTVRRWQAEGRLPPRRSGPGSGGYGGITLAALARVLYADSPHVELQDLREPHARALRQNGSAGA